MNTDRKRNAVLINPPYGGVDDDALEENLGLSYIAGYLRERGIDTAICEMTGKEPLDTKLAALHIADVYGISMYSTAVESTKSIIRHIRRIAPAAPIYLGGPHPSALPEESLAELGADGVIVGEGEAAFYAVVLAANEGNPIGGVIRGEQETDLDRIPFPARDMVERGRFTRRLNGEPCISMLTSRGCPYSCLHCNSIVMGGAGVGFRFRSVENVIEEIRLIKELGYRNIRFNDDNFLANPRLHELLAAIAKEDILFRVFGRVEDYKPDTCALLKNAGCQMLSAGIESCNPDNLRFLRKHGMLKYMNHLTAAKERGLAVRASFMVGLPYDTDASIERYFTEASGLAIDEYAVYGLIPYPGTALYANPEQYNYYITSFDFSRYMQIGKGGESCFVLGYDDGVNAFTPEDVRRWHRRANELLGNRLKHMRDSAVQ
ncbi:MAG: B12-binding domain-containing radical SAM protein [Clostridiales Family XIII bacterium]|jgi:anaerobic magnesium-protoporphyrin IX monomethyl ester cyclase|nr:B12-binding domain-containing radical SAM protein [Clostridiales Family XIII bacterium]